MHRLLYYLPALLSFLLPLAVYIFFFYFLPRPANCFIKFGFFFLLISRHFVFHYKYWFSCKKPLFVIVYYFIQIFVYRGQNTNIVYHWLCIWPTQVWSLAPYMVPLSPTRSCTWCAPHPKYLYIIGIYIYTYIYWVTFITWL